MKLENMKLEDMHSLLPYGAIDEIAEKIQITHQGVHLYFKGKRHNEVLKEKIRQEAIRLINAGDVMKEKTAEIKRVASEVLSDGKEELSVLAKAKKVANEVLNS